MRRFTIIEPEPAPETEPRRLTRREALQFAAAQKPAEILKPTRQQRRAEERKIRRRITR